VWVAIRAYGEKAGFFNEKKKLDMNPKQGYIFIS